MTENLRTILRCTGVALVVIAALVLVPAAAEAQHRTGLAISKDCPTDPVDQGDTATCTFIVTNLDTSHGVENLTVENEFPFPGGTTTPGVCLRDGLPVTTLGVAGSATDSCSGSFDEVAPISCNDTTETLTDQVRAAGTDCAAQCGVDDEDPDVFEGLPSTGSTTNVIRVNPIDCPDAPICNTVACVPGTGCVTTPDQDSTPCGTDTDGNECTAPGCAGGTCVQNHILVDDSTPCGTDGDPTDCVTPGCVAGVCSPTHNNVDDSTPCGTDGDTTDCTTPGCIGGVCSQTHNNVDDSTPCGTDSDATDCTTPGCIGGVCSQTHVNLDASTPCGTDTDGLACTIPGCPGGGAACSQTHVDNCGVEICRTPGFWGTHGGIEKEGRSTNITEAVLDCYPGLVICGTPINNTDECSVNSALEAICVSPKGDSVLQLGRQLTAAALNCIMTRMTDAEGACACPADGLTGDVCDGVSVEGIFEACNAACATDPPTLTVTIDGNVINCISAIDCFNNGGVFDPTDGSCDEALVSCADQALCADFQPPGAAGSPGECNDSRKNCVTIFGPTDQCDAACIP